MVVSVGALLASQPSWDVRKLSAGLFRYRTANPELAAGPGSLVQSLQKDRTADYVRFYDDDPSTSVAVFHAGEADLTGARLAIAARTLKSWFVVVETRQQLELAERRTAVSSVSSRER